METRTVRVQDPDTKQEREVTLALAAAELADLEPDVTEARRVIAQHDALVTAVREAAEEDTPIPAGPGRTITLVRVGGQNRVNRGVCQTFRAELVRAGVSEQVTVPATTTYTDPKVSDLKPADVRAKLLALGVPLDQLVAVTGGTTELVVTNLNAEQEAA